MLGNLFNNDISWAIVRYIAFSFTPSSLFTYYET